MVRQSSSNYFVPKGLMDQQGQQVLLVGSIHSECAIFQQLKKDEASCLVKQQQEYNSSEPEGCPSEWDGLRCWPRAAHGETVNITCPEFFSYFTKKKGVLYRNCTVRGWQEPSPDYPIACKVDDMEPENQSSYYATFQDVYTAGYATSLISLITAFVIFALFRKFHCTRNYIHMHLFMSFILRAVAVFTKDAILFTDEDLNHCLVSTVSCKAAISFFQFSILANFFWLLVEGMYLQTLLALTFISEKQYFWWYIIIGWGTPAAVLAVWTLFRVYSENTGCWDDNANVGIWWIIKGPILFAVLVNFYIFLMNNYKKLAKSTLLLIPLFGVHYIVFAFFPEDTGFDDARLFLELGLGSFQGFVVALLYCFLNGEVQAEVKKRMGRLRYQGYLAFSQRHRASSTESSVINFVTQFSLLEKLSPKRKPSGYQNCRVTV
nr:PREDICTED: pituitary adenylate cyclase-activating polypeptide type I receptor-like [Latimeria chalumnae]|eukprot:XP_014345885.1 PREDICTED: pituitary adenylate cyclase-activating polypeptide type I receptor-like [Latimeria chalumnae]